MTETRRHGAGDETTDELQTPRWTVVPGPARTPSRGARRQGFRTTVAVDAGRFAATMSRRLGMGSGAMIGGRIALSLQPRLLANLAAGRQVVMVTGTNGKTTTTQMVVEALRSRGEAVSNATGANMLDGHVAALMARRDAPYAALEVDELHLAQVTREFEPAVAILLNLSRDQLDRVGEIRTVERSIRNALQQAPEMHVVANRDDPNIVSAAAEHPGVTWISGGARWVHDALNCPRCGAFIEDTNGPWQCACGLARPEADWTVTGDALVGPDGTRYDIELSLPGHVNRINAAFALAAALHLGCHQEKALDRISRVDQANGRYGAVTLAGRPVRLLLAKNPASWLEMLELVSSHDRPLVLVVNSREADGFDVSWLWDVDFEVLAGRSVLVTGDRGLDLAVRLRYAGVRCDLADSVEEALDTLSGDSGTPEIIANYTAFRDLFARSRA
jgi:UDP-N-acetylmuramyl tripeptide synthase